jgi:hypothetical protein
MFGNTAVTQNLAVTNADFTHYCITAPVDSRLPGSGGQMCGFYDVNVTKFGQVNNLITGAENFGSKRTCSTVLMSRSRPACRTRRSWAAA